MKNNILIFLLIIITAIFIVSFNNKVTVEDSDIMVSGIMMRTYTIDSCEYIGSIHGSNGDVLTHKGNCKFCIKRNKNIN